MTLKPTHYTLFYPEFCEVVFMPRRHRTGILYMTTGGLLGCITVIFCHQSYSLSRSCSVAKVLVPAASNSEDHLLPILRQEAFRTSNLETEDKTFWISFQGQGGRWPPPHGRGTGDPSDGDEHVALLSIVAGEVRFSVSHGDLVDVGLVPLNHGPRDSSGGTLLVLVVQVDGHQGTSQTTVLLRKRLPLGPQGLLPRVLTVVRASEENTLEASFVAPPQLSYNQALVNSVIFSAYYTSFLLFLHLKHNHLRCKRPPHPSRMGFSFAFCFDKIRFKNAALTGECVQPWI